MPFDHIEYALNHRRPDPHRTSSRCARMTCVNLRHHLHVHFHQCGSLRRGNTKVDARLGRVRVYSGQLFSSRIARNEALSLATSDSTSSSHYEDQANSQEVDRRDGAPQIASSHYATLAS